jgi:hypothetical protein
VNAKLCVTLESEDSVESVLNSAVLLRSSSNASTNRVFFNRDLTRSQAEEAYRKRCEKRAEFLILGLILIYYCSFYITFATFFSAR